MFYSDGAQELEKPSDIYNFNCHKNNINLEN